MKAIQRIGIGLALALLASGEIFSASAEVIKIGDTPETVLHELGKPQGRMTSGTYDVFIYDRGKVEFQKGLVTTIELISAEEVLARRIAQEKHQQEAHLRAEQARESRKAAGDKLLAEQLADSYFRKQPASEQLTYWELFQKQYPKTDIGTTYIDLARQYQMDLEQAQIREQLADLRQRTAAAEARALRAEQAAEEAYLKTPTITYIPVPWVQSYSPYCPPSPIYNSQRQHCENERGQRRFDYDKPTTRYTRPVTVTTAGAIPPTTRKITTANTIQLPPLSTTTGATIRAQSGATFRH